MPRPPAGRARASVASTLASLTAVLLGALTALSAVAGIDPPDPSLGVEVTQVPLDPADGSRTRVGPLHYLGGLWLRSDDPRFGGLSDLRVSEDGSQLWAVSDCGSGLTAHLSYDAAGRLSGLDGARLVALTDSGGLPLRPGEIDAESLVVTPQGDLEVGFEGRGRIEAYRAGFQGPARSIAAPPALAECGRNGGVELMADAGGGQRLLVCETRRAPSGSVPAWTGASDAWQRREYPLSFDGGWAGEPFRPTAAALLPSGDLLVLERRFPPLAVRLASLQRATLDGGGALVRSELARLEPPLSVDNFEGVAVRRDESGRTLVYLLSDDNDCAKTRGAARRGLQRTLLLLFALEPPGR